MQIGDITVQHNTAGDLTFLNQQGVVVQVLTVAQQASNLADYDAVIAQDQSDKQAFQDMITAVLAEPPVDGG
jgi:putative heme degradation protein